jgi:pyruvate kinase
MLPRRAKIVCTIGPASNTPDKIDALIAAGMDVARLNFSHGTHEDHAAVIRAIREVSERRKKAIAILGDLCGPKIRLGRLGTPPRLLEQGSEVVLVAGTESTDETLPVRYPTLATDVRVGDMIHLDDARVGLRITAVEGERVRCVVEEPGQVRNNVGVHLPSGHLQIETLTAKDKQDLMFCLTAGVDYIAISFVRGPEDVKLVREICEAWGEPLPIVSKIETPQAIDALDEIVKISDAVMVARGDLGVEFPPEQVPVLQRRVIASARMHRRPVIVATEMLHSMVKATRPTRAEASDVATAIYDGADATMLSQESAAGDHPALAVAMMARIVTAAESSAFYAPKAPPLPPPPSPFPDAVARMAVSAARDVGARLIVVFTQGGESARLISTERPGVPVIAFSPHEGIRRRIAMYWGTLPRVLLPVRDTDEMVDMVEKHLIANGYVSLGDKIVLVYGAPISIKGRTNTLRVHQIST